MPLHYKRWYYLAVSVLLAAAMYFIAPVIFDSNLLKIGLLFILYPAYNVISTMLYTVKFGFHSEMPVIVSLMYIPSALIFFNKFSLCYTVLYVISAMAGCAVGWIVHSKYHRSVVS